MYAYPDLIGEELAYRAGRVLVTDSLHERLVSLPGDGSGAVVIVADLTPYGELAMGLAVDATHAFITMAKVGRVVRVAIATGSVDLPAQGTPTTGAIAVDEGCVSWVETVNEGFAASKVIRARKPPG